jgi:hypothetical protein
MTTATIPVSVTIQPEALLLADKLGMRETMERLIEQMKAMAPQLISITVEVEIHPEDPTFPHLIAIDGVEPRSARPPTDLSLLNAYRQWVSATFTPAEWNNFIFGIVPRG